MQVYKNVVEITLWIFFSDKRNFIEPCRLSHQSIIQNGLGHCIRITASKGEDVRFEMTAGHHPIYW